METETHVDLPPHVVPPFEVYVNGVPQVEGTDYRHENGVLWFSRSLAQEGKLGFWRYLSMLLGVAGTYRKNDSVDVISTVGGRQHVTSLVLESRPTDDAARVRAEGGGEG